jgi:hypothetical protein
MTTCAPPARSRPYVSGPSWFNLFINNFPHVGGFQYDLLQQIPILANCFFLLGGTLLTNTFFFHLSPTGLPNPGSGGPVIGGNENWVALTTSPYSSGPLYFTKIKLGSPVNRFYLSLGTEAGAGSKFTLACVAGDDIDISGGQWT